MLAIGSQKKAFLPFLHYLHGVRRISLQTASPWRFTDEMAVSHSDKLDITLKNYLPSNKSGSSEQLQDKSGRAALNQDKMSQLGQSGQLGQLNADAAATPILPAGSHMVFFNHIIDETELSADGYDGMQAPIGNFPARRWYGGSVEFNINTHLRLGEPATCMEHIHDIKSTARSHRVNVTISRSMKNDSDSEPWAIRERRSMFYFGSESLGLLEKQTSKHVKAHYVPRYSHAFKPSRILLFRYSALNFNAHLIHYDPLYSQQKEKLPNICVQGPLMVTLMLRWMDEYVLSGTNRRIQLLDYRNVAPLFADDEALLCATPITQDSFEVWIQTATGDVALSGTVIVS